MYLLLSLLVFAFIHEVFSRSIQNTTSEESKFITVDMFEGLKKNMSEMITDLVEKRMQTETEKKHVFFYARMSTSDTVLNKNSILKFGKVLYNKGNHFNSGDSIFIAPLSGVYMFSWTVRSYTSKFINTELRVNNIVKEILNVNMGSSGYYLFTRIVLCNVTKGNHVWIQTGSQHSENFFQVLYQSTGSFMGILMYEA